MINSKKFYRLTLVLGQKISPKLTLIPSSKKNNDKSTNQRMLFSGW